MHIHTQITFEELYMSGLALNLKENPKLEEYFLFLYYMITDEELKWDFYMFENRTMTNS